jgi:hypothetical protein
MNALNEMEQIGMKRDNMRIVGIDLTDAGLLSPDLINSNGPD